MTGYVVRRLAQSVVVLLGVTLLVFVLEHLVPGSLARAILGPRASPGALARFEQANGLDRPVVVQYLVFLGHVLEGNLGRSYRLNQTVDALVLHQLPNDVVLVGTALVLALAIAVPLGIAQALRRNRLFDHATTGAVFALYSTPSYCLGLLLVAGLAVAVHAFPPEAPQSTSLGGILGDPRALVLPVLTLTLVNVALFSRYMRSSALATLAEDFVTVARGKGAGGIGLVRRHVLRNSLLAVVTIVGLSLPAVLTSGLVVEYLFNFPGIGLTYFTAAVNSDYPLMLGITVLVGFTTVAGNLLADVLYAVLDPRVRYG
jgi:peptide/nickel transport system permease protein